MQLQLFHTGPGEPPKITDDKRARWREESRRYRAEHPERIKAKYEKRRDHYIDYMRQWRKENPGYHSQWKRENPDKRWAIESTRRARLAGTFVEKIDRKKVFERDGYICHLCGEPTEDQKAPHPRSPSIDHVIPLSRGGEHSYANVKTAHFHCNSVKSYRLEEEMAS